MPAHPSVDLDGADSDLGVAITAALAGAALGLSYFDRVSGLDQERKADGSIVTEADLAVEREVRDVLSAARSSDAFIGEETGVAGSSNRRWILDGIDGTLVFVLGDDRWQSLIALEVDGVIEVGVAIVPSQAEVWFAQRGGGAFRQSFDETGLVGSAQRLRTSGRTALSGCGTGYLPPLDMVPLDVFAEVAPLLDLTTSLEWSAHGALLVARGELDAAVQVGGKLWDYAPLGLITSEAGGAFAGVDGATHPVEGAALFAATSELLDAAMSAIDDARDARDAHEP